MVAGAGMKLMVLISSWHSWLDSMYVLSWWLEQELLKLMVFICSWHSWLDRE
jgi:hypothetical protein